MLKKRELLLFVHDRLAVSLLAALLLGALILIVMTALSVRVNDVQVPVRYSGYGFTNLYRDKWFALMSFGLFPLIIFLTNGFLAIKIFSSRRALAIGLLVLSLFIMIVALIITQAVFRLAAYSL